MLKAALKASFGGLFRKKYQFIIDRDRKRDIERIRKYSARFDDPAYGLDDRSWDDLNMDAVYAGIDSTLTNPGEDVLYSLLRTPQTDRDQLGARRVYIDYFQNNKAQKREVQEILYRAGRDDLDITGMLTGELNPNPLMRAVCIALPLLLLASAVYLLLALNLVGLFIIMALFATTIFTHLWINHVFHHRSDAAMYLGKLVNISDRIIPVIEGDFPSLAAEIKEIYRICKPIGKGVLLLSRIEGIDVLADQLLTVSLAKERKFFKMLKDIQCHKVELLRLYRLLGELDAYISIAAYREEVSHWCAPEIVSEKGILECADIYHPLVDDPVSNSISIAGKGILITGSNMSGKSTFLRTLAINTLFAQTICTCLASRYRTGIYHIVTSMSIRDDVLAGKSYYLREAEAILRIIRASEQDIECLAVIDEMFRGTNAVDRVHASIEVLRYLSAHNALPLIATHDMQIVPRLSDYEQYYFTEDISVEGDLTYDYRIRRGIAPSRNAIKILERLGYPPEIIQGVHAQSED